MSSLPSADLGAIATRVRERFAKAQMDSHEAALEIGRELLAAKALLDHGAFLPWIEEQFEFSVQTAHNFMNYTARLADKFQTVRNLPLGVAYLIAKPSTPEPVRAKVVMQASEGRVDPVQVRVMVKEAKAAEKLTVRVSKMKPAQQRAHRRKERDQAADQAAWQAKRDAEKAAAAEAGAMIEKALGDDLPAFLEKLQAASIYEFRAYLLGG